MNSTTLHIWTIYDHPNDYPDKFVARRWEVTDGESKPTDEIITSENLEHIQMAMRRRRLHCIPRFKEDDKKIIETWL